MSLTRRDLLLLSALTIALFGVGLGTRDLWNPNEPIYGEAVREMQERGSWLVPYVNGRVFGEKPILYYWMALAASKLFGAISEFSLRIPVAFAGLATVLVTYLLVLPYAGRRRAFVSAAFCATLYGIWWNARFVQMDILVTATTLGVVACVSRVVDHRGDRRRGWALAGALAGLGFLAKGPVAWICPALVVVAYLGLTRRLAELLRIEVLLAAGTAIAVAAPWYVALAASGRMDVLHEVLIRQNFNRFTNPWDHARPFWYYLEYFWIDFAPWALLVPLAWALPRKEEGERRLALLSAAWILAIVLFFSLSRSKRSPYVLPVAPAVAILAAEVAVAFAEERLTRARRNAFLAIASVLGALLVLGGAGAGLFVFFHHPEYGSAVRPTAAALVAGGIVVLGAVVAPRLRRGVVVPAALAVAFALVYAVASATTLPAMDDAKSARKFCDEVKQRLRPGDDLVSVEFWNWRAEYAYYLGRPLRNLSGAAALREAWEGPRRVMLVVEEERIEAARAVIGDVDPLYVRRIGRYPAYLFTNRPEEMATGSPSGPESP